MCLRRLAAGRRASRSTGSRHSNDVISTWPLSFLSWLSCVILDALLETGWRHGYRQLQAHHLSLAFLPCLYIDFNEEPKSCKAPDYDIGAIASYPNFVPALLYPYKQNASWDHLFLLELRESLWKVVWLFTGICETATHVPGTSGGWNPGMSEVTQAKDYRESWDPCPTRGCIPITAEHQMSESRLGARSSYFSKKPEIQICM